MIRIYQADLLMHLRRLVSAGSSPANAKLTQFLSNKSIPFHSVSFNV